MRGQQTEIRRASRPVAICDSALQELGDAPAADSRAASRCRGGESMNKAEMADRLAARTGMNKVPHRRAWPAPRLQVRTGDCAFR